MNVLKIMPLFFFLSIKNVKLFSHSLTGGSYQIPPGESAERSEYQSDLSKGIPTCSHHFHSSGHTHSPVITSRPQSLPSHILASRRRSRRISCGFKQRHTAKIKDITHHPAARLNSCTHTFRQVYVTHLTVFHLHVFWLLSLIEKSYFVWMQHRVIWVYWQEMQTFEQKNCLCNLACTLTSWNTHHTDCKHTLYCI